MSACISRKEGRVVVWREYVTWKMLARVSARWKVASSAGSGRVNAANGLLLSNSRKALGETKGKDGGQYKRCMVSQSQT